MRRFIIPRLTISASPVTLTGDLFHHIARVLRLKKGATLLLGDGAGHEYTGTISRVSGESIEVVLAETRTPPAATRGPCITLFQGLPKGDKLDFILQKCTELGAARIVPFQAERSVAKVPPARLNDKLDRWRRITIEAARQSQRSDVPEVSFAGELSDVLAHADHDVKLLLWEEEEAGTLRKVLATAAPPQSIAVVVGPEGGLTREEVTRAEQCGFLTVSLGKRIVRTETAGLAILAILQFFWGDMG